MEIDQHEDRRTVGRCQGVDRANRRWGSLPPDGTGAKRLSLGTRSPFSRSQTDESPVLLAARLGDVLQGILTLEQLDP